MTTLTVEKADERMTSDKIEDLQVLHAELLATAADLGIEVPDDLALEFETAPVGRATCESLHSKITAFRAGLDAKDMNGADVVVVGDDIASDVTTDDNNTSPKPKRKRATATKKSKGQTAETKPDEAAKQPEQEKSDVTEETKAKKKASPKKAPAKKAAPKKAAKAKAAPKKAAKAKAPAKKAAPKKAAANPMPKAKKYGENAKIKVIEKNPAALEKKSKWADRLRKVIAANGKKVKDAGVPIGDIRTAEWRGVISVVE